MSNGSLAPVLQYLRQSVVEARPPDATDAQLLEEFVQRRDPIVFELLMQRHGPMVLGTCKRILSCPHDAEDAFQATFLVLARKAASIGRRELLGSWLYGVAFRTAQKLRRQSMRWQSAEDVRLKEANGDQCPIAHFARQEAKEILDEEVHRLPRKYRVPVVLCYFEGQTYAEAARRIGCPAGTVAGRLARARALLRARLSRRGLTISASLLGTLLADVSVSAEVSAGLLQSTTRAASGQTAGSVSSQVLTLSEGVIYAMTLTKIKGVMACLAACLVVIAGAGGLALRGQSAGPAQEPANPFAQPGVASGAPVKAATKAQQLENRLAQLKRLDEEVKKLRKEAQQEAMSKVEQAIEQLKRTAADPNQGRAISEFEKAYKTLKGRLTNQLPGIPGGGIGGFPGGDFEGPTGGFPGDAGGGFPPGAGGGPGAAPPKYNSDPRLSGNRTGFPGGATPPDESRAPTNRGGSSGGSGFPGSGNESFGPGAFPGDDGLGGGFVPLGQITQVSSSSKTVTINLGAKHGITKGQVLQVYRLQPKATSVAQIKIVKVTTTSAVGTFNLMKQVTSIRVKDKVAPIPEGGSDYLK